MVVLVCSECGQQMSREATACPHCGASPPKEAPSPQKETTRKISASGTYKCRGCGREFFGWEDNCKACGILDPVGFSVKERRCHGCGRTVTIGANEICPFCGTRPSSKKPSSRETASSSKPKEPDRVDLAMGISGAVMVFFGVFAPIVSAPIFGGMDYFTNGRVDGALVMVAAVVAFILVLSNRTKALWAPGGLSLGLLLIAFISFQGRLSEARSGLRSELAGNPFANSFDARMDTVRLDWGWAVLVLGSGLLLAAGIRSYIREAD